MATLHPTARPFPMSQGIGKCRDPPRAMTTQWKPETRNIMAWFLDFSVVLAVPIFI